jgi:cytidine deaminase
MAKPLGVFTHFADLSQDEKIAVKTAWEAANVSRDIDLCYISKFPVGSAIVAQNAAGETKLFSGCNVENKFMPATICAERNAATTAVYNGYTKFLLVATVCAKAPAGSPCGLCRQVLTEFGKDAVLLNIVDKDSNVRKAHGCDLLPAVSSPLITPEMQSSDVRKIGERLVALVKNAHTPYSKRARSAIFVTSGGDTGPHSYEGVSVENAAYSASINAESVAMHRARAEGLLSLSDSRDRILYVLVEDTEEHNPLDGESLQILREFGEEATIWLFDKSGNARKAELEEMLPDSFGPEAL